MNKNIIGHAAVFVTTILVALSILSTKFELQVDNPVSLVLLRFASAALIMLVILLVTKKIRDVTVILLLKGLAVGFCYVAYFIWMFFALRHTSTLHVSSITTLSPLMVSVISIFFFKERMTLFQTVVYIFALFCTLMVIFDGNISYILAFRLNSGDYIYGIAVIFMSFYQIFIRFFYGHESDFLSASFCTLLGGAIWCGILALVLHTHIGWGNIHGVYFFNMIYLIVGATLFTVYLYQLGILEIGPRLSSSYIYFMPIIVLIVNYIFFKGVTNNIVILFSILTVLSTIFLQYLTAKDL